VAEPQHDELYRSDRHHGPLCLIRRASHGRRFLESRQLAQTLLSLHYNIRAGARLIAPMG